MESFLTLDLELDLKLDLVQIPAGEFWMGADLESYEQKPQHVVSLPEFWMGKYTVTVAQYAMFAKTTGYPTRPVQLAELANNPDFPVVNVTWYDAQAFCRWVDAALPQKGGVLGGWQARLPSEAEWEKAARGTDGREFPWGNQPPDATQCNFNWKLGALTPVGHYSPQGDSPYGCADMAGNVWEWTHSLNQSYPYRSDDGRESEAGSEQRVVRGGAGYSYASSIRCSIRAFKDPAHDFTSCGFRLCVSPLPL